MFLRNKMLLAPEGAPGGAPTPPAAPPAAPAPVAPAAPPAAPPTSQQPAGTTTTPGAQTPPAEVRITLPAGMQEDAEVMGGLKAWAREHGISEKAAQALVDAQIGLGKKRSDAQAKAWETWKQNEAKALRDEWGAQFDTNMDSVNKFVRLVSEAAGLKAEEVIAHLAKTGASSDRVLVKMFAKLAPLALDDKLNLGAPAGATTEPTREQALRQMFNKSPEWLFQKRK